MTRIYNNPPLKNNNSMLNMTYSKQIWYIYVCIRDSIKSCVLKFIKSTYCYIQRFVNASRITHSITLKRDVSILLTCAFGALFLFLFIRFEARKLWKEYSGKDSISNTILYWHLLDCCVLDQRKHEECQASNCCPRELFEQCLQELFNKRVTSSQTLQNIGCWCRCWWMFSCE